MKNSIFVSELSAVFERELRELSTGSAHTFSEGFDKKMSSLINAFPSRIKMTLSRHRKRAAVTAAAAAAVILLSPALWAVINIIALSMFGLDSTASSMPDEENMGVYENACHSEGDEYSVFLNYDYDQPTTLFDYNYSPDNKGKVTENGEENDISARLRNVGDFRSLSDGLIVARVIGEGEEKQTPAKERYILTELEVLYDITDKNNELYAHKTIYVGRFINRIPQPLTPDSFVLVMITKTDKGENEYWLSNGAKTCFYIDKTELTVTSLSADMVCAKYDGLPLGMLVYDMLNKPDIYEDTQKQSSPG